MHFHKHLGKPVQFEIFICIRIVMNIQKSAGVSDPLSIPGTFIFRLNSRSQVFEKGGLDQALRCLAAKEVILLFLNIREGKGSAAVKFFFFFVLVGLRIVLESPT